MFDRMRKSEWFVPFCISIALHLAAVIVLFLVHMTFPEKSEEKNVYRFRVKGVRNLPRIPGELGGGNTRAGSVLKFTSNDKTYKAGSVSDVSMQKLVEEPAFPKRELTDVSPKKVELDSGSSVNSRDFATLLKGTDERQLSEKVQSKQVSTASSSGVEKILSQSHRPSQDNLLQFLGKPLAGLGLQAVQSVNIDPEEGMPGFTPMGSGGGGGGGAGSNGLGSNGGFPDGVDQSIGEPQAAVMKYSSLDPFMDVQVYTYQDPSDSKKYFMIRIFPKKNVKVFKVMPKEILFTIDCSLSITQDRLDEVKRGIRYCLEHLNPQDVFNIVAFKDSASFFKKESVPASPKAIHEAEQFVMGLTPSHQTDVYSPFTEIVGNPLSRTPSDIMLISDGRPTAGIVDSRELINSITKVNKKVRPIFVFSGGMKVNRYLLDFIAYQNRGWSQFMKRSWDIHKGLADFYDKIKDPIFLNLRYRLSGVNERDVFPKSLPDFYKNAEFTLYGSYADEDQFSMQLLGDIDGETHELVFTRSLKDAAKGNADIMKGYAFNRIYYLINRITSGGPKPEILKEIQDLGKRYGVTTPYSSDLSNLDKY